MGHYENEINMVTQLRHKATRILFAAAVILLLAGTTVTPTYAAPFNAIGTTN